MKLKNHLLRSLSVLALSALVLAGCGGQTPPAGSAGTSGQTPPAGSADTSGQTGGQSVETESLLTVVDLLGKSDAEVKDRFGGGTENRTEDGATLLGRSYTTTLDGTAVTLESVYAEDQTVVSVSASFPEQTPEEVKSIMTAAFGQGETLDETEAMDTKTLTWTQDQAFITMNESYGMSTVEFTLNRG